MDSNAPANQLPHQVEEMGLPLIEMGKVLRDEQPMPQGPGRDERIEELVDTLECPVCLDTADTAPIYQVTRERQFPFSKIAKDCLLAGQEQACTRISWLFVCLSSPCRKWPNTQGDGC